MSEIYIANKEGHKEPKGQNGYTYLCSDLECARNFPHPVPARHEYSLSEQEDFLDEARIGPFIAI